MFRSPATFRAIAWYSSCDTSLSSGIINLCRGFSGHDLWVECITAAQSKSIWKSHQKFSWEKSMSKVISCLYKTFVLSRLPLVRKPPTKPPTSFILLCSSFVAFINRLYVSAVTTGVANFWTKSLQVTFVFFHTLLATFSPIAMLKLPSYFNLPTCIIITFDKSP